MGCINERNVDWETLDGGEMHVKRKQLGQAAGSEQLGCSMYELPPGEQAWPYHYHAANEEAIYVLAGSGIVRLQSGPQEIEAGDFVALPADERGAHKVINDSAERLQYLMISTMDDPDVTVYPDSGKIGVFAGEPPGGGGQRRVHGYYRLEDEVDYWEGE